jgi:hypothetical protein
VLQERTAGEGLGLGRGEMVRFHNAESLRPSDRLWKCKL